MNPRVCGHSIEEHGHDKKHPGSTACNECDCIAYEADENADEESPESEEEL
jgi:hypothetical protein